MLEILRAYGKVRREAELKAVKCTTPPEYVTDTHNVLI